MVSFKYKHETKNIERLIHFFLIRLIQSLEQAQMTEKQIKKIGEPEGWEANKQMHHFDKKKKIQNINKTQYTLQTYTMIKKCIDLPDKSSM